MTKTRKNIIVFGVSIVEEDVLEKNEMVRFRYGAMMKRFDKFDFD